MNKNLWIIVTLLILIILSIAIKNYNTNSVKLNYFTGNLTATEDITTTFFPEDIIFYADKIILKDDKIELIWNESGVFGFDLAFFNEIQFNLGNKTYNYVLQEDSE